MLKTHILAGKHFILLKTCPTKPESLSKPNWNLSEKSEKVVINQDNSYKLLHLSRSNFALKALEF